MDSLENPFSPGAGFPPPALAGRDALLEQARILLGRAKVGRSGKSILMTGLRGVGKTVLLSHMSRLALEAGYRVIQIEAHDDKPLPLLLVPPMRTLLYDLDRLAGAGHRVRRGLSVLKSFLSGLKLSYQGFEVGLDVEPELGAADSGDLQADLPNLFVALAEAAQERGGGIALLIDEIQYLNPVELGALIMAMHKVQQHQLPLVLFGAGLPTLPGLAGESKSYAERLFTYPVVGALSREDSYKALQEPVAESGVAFTSDALAEIYRVTLGYPYFVQEWGYQAWNDAEHSPIAVDVIHTATDAVTARLDQDFFRVRFDRLTPTEKRYLRAMASLGEGPYRTAEVAKAMGRSGNSLAPTRDGLIKKGMIYSPSHGEQAFTVPLFDAFMRRAIPE